MIPKYIQCGYHEQIFQSTTFITISHRLTCCWKTTRIWKKKKNRENISILQWWKPNKAPGDLKLQSSWKCWFSCDLTHWGWVTHICISKLTIISSDNGLAPTNAAILLIGPVRTNFREIVIKTQTFSLKKIHVKRLSGKWQPFCLALNVPIVQ